jgi:chemotaxis protein MotB
MRWLIVLALAGCLVKKTTYDKAVADREAKIAALQQQLAQANKDKDAKDAALTAANGQQQATAQDLADLQAARDADQKRLAALQDLQDHFKELVDAGTLEIAFRHGQMTLKLPSGVLFPSAGADLSDAGKKTLAKITKLLLDFQDRRFLVAGHTDNVPISTPQFANNWYLSSARAIAVAQFMIDNGFPAKQLGAAGYADQDPVASNKTKKGRQKNRRIEIILVPDLSEVPKLTKPKK